jgi:hypothetical protein
MSNVRLIIVGIELALSASTPTTGDSSVPMWINLSV